MAFVSQAYGGAYAGAGVPFGTAGLTMAPTYAAAAPQMVEFAGQPTYAAAPMTYAAAAPQVQYLEAPQVQYAAAPQVQYLESAPEVQ
jgi:hypothetical protein